MGADHVATRWVRALTLALVVVVASAGGHAAAAGATPPPAVLLPLLLLTAVGVSPFVDAPLAPVRVTLLVLGGQLFIHVALVLTSGVHHHSDGPLMGYAAPGHLAMLAVHLGAAVVIGLWLTAGERGAHAALHLATRPWREAQWAAVGALELLRGVLVVRRPAPMPVRVDSIAPPSRVWDGGQVVRRGPPLPCC